MMACLDSTYRACVDFYGGNKMVAWGEGPAPFDLAPRLSCPLLGLYGLEDSNPSPDDVARLDAELTRLGKTHEFHSYPGAGHAFMNDGRPSYRPEAAEDAWRRTLEFLAEHLR
jgi:carboxymethylenebutenolidase